MDPGWDGESSELRDPKETPPSLGVHRRPKSFLGDATSQDRLKGLSRSLLSVTPGDQEQACCEYWSTIPEIYYKLNITSTPEDFNLRLELEKDTLLKSNLAAFRNISEKFFSVSNASLSISKNLEKLENLLQTLPMPMPTPQREVYIQAEDFNEFSEKLKIFLEALDDFLKPLLKCPGTFKASCKRS
ncbi:interleukin-3 [Lycaon pictus]